MKKPDIFKKKSKTDKTEESVITVDTPAGEEESGTGADGKDAPPEPEDKESSETTTDIVAADDAELSDDTPAYVPGKKKKHVVRWIILALIVVAVIYFIIKSRMAGSAPMQVETAEVTKGSIEETVTISGTVTASTNKTYYADLTATINSVPVKTGDRIKKGDLIIDYDADELALTKRQAELNVEQAEGSYSGTMEKNAKATDVLRGNSIHDINNRLDEIVKEIDAINYKIQEKTDRMSGTLTELQEVALDINQNGIADSAEAAYTAAWNEQNDGDAEVNLDYLTRLQNGEGDSNVYASEENQQMALAVQKSIADKQYALQHDPEIEKWQREITALNEESATLQGQKSAEMSRLTSGEKKAMDAQKELAELSADDTISDVEEAEKGVRADFAGVVTEVTVNEGMTVTKGTRMVSVASTEDIEVDIQIAKADMNRIKTGQSVDITVNGHEYSGTVGKISGTAVKNASGVPVVNAVIEIKNPDAELVLGVEASNKIHTNKADDVIVIPYEFVGSDADGDFVYLYKDGTSVRQNVTVGITTSTMAEIREGLSEGDQLITSDTDTMTDGAPVALSLSVG
ncbi:MAG: efflux RND transporter periplasmic adaptor subunit [Lachnospiraceae bacterium]|nr:efflux RND transporter periplasmic adaptor subunit [Lachnospiraceae bacterium]